MLRSIFTKTLRDERRALVGWALGIILLAVLIIVAYSSIKGRLHDYDKLIASYPKALKALLGVSDLGSATGYLNTELFGFMIPVLFLIFAVLTGSDSTSGEEERRTLDLLLANPVSRSRLVAEKYLAVAIAIGAIGALFFAALAVGCSVAGMNVSVGRLAGACVATALLGMLFAALALALGCATGRRGLSRGVSAALAVLAYFASALADLVGWVKPLRPFSPYYHALGVDPLAKGLGLGHVAFLVAVTAGLFALAVITFRRRDLSI